MRLLWLGDVLRAAELDVEEHGDWRNRGRDLQSVDRIICHHTATGKTWTDPAVAGLLINGRPDLPGPLSQLGLDREGTFHLIAAGKANHNGYGLSGNNTIGIEAYNDGRGEPWLAVQMDAFIRGCAAICRHLGWPAEKVLGHKESDPGRKIDPTFDMAMFRRSVAALLDAPVTPQQEDDDVLLYRVPGNDKRWICIQGKFTLLDGDSYKGYQAAGVREAAVTAGHLKLLGVTV